ncbi:MAG: host-nuclease inhibitor Gam family protein [Peptococcales bacterium]|jgi:phage host-nuclease inhibitor protein Gam
MMDMKLLTDDLFDVPEQTKEQWKIIDDLTADWTLDKIRDIKAEYNRFEMVAKAKIEQIQKALNNKKINMEHETGFFEGKLRDYFETVKTKETKTQKTYALPSGKLKLKFQKPEIVRNEDALVEYLEKNKMDELIKVKKTADWMELKKKISLVDEGVVNIETGETIPGITLVDRPPRFEVEV